VPSSSRPKRTSDQDRLDAILHALSDRTRRALLARLAAGPAIVSDLAEPFDVTRVAISKHLRVLEHAHLVSRTVDGRVRRCALTAAPLQEVERWLADYRSFWTQKLEALAGYAQAERKSTAHRD
jgi:DNA-binding transcriptional ArsR family regulator